MIEIAVPRLGWSMEEGTFSEWLKREGDWVETGEMLFVLESDKAAQEVESFDAGVLRIAPAGAKPGDTVQVGQVIGYLLARDEVATFDAPSKAPAVANEAIAERAAATGPTFQETPLEPAGNARDTAGRAASPRARRVAHERGVDWQTLAGTGRGGRVRERDVLAAAGADAGVSRAAPLSTTRRTIAERMMASLRSTAPVTLTTKIDAANLINLRRQFKAAADNQDAPGLTDIAIKLAAVALEKHPDMNSRWQDTQIIRLEEIHIGMAVDTDAGLLVPVVRDAARLGLRQIAALSRALADKARQRRLSAEELRGGTFTVTNLGNYGIDAFTPIINAPETAILGLGAIRREARVLDDDRIVPGESMTLSLTFDHRIVDGAPAARFLQTIRTLMENPAAWLVG
jgi:pyruvate dehydrogenase E2 component (dihydrolipoamide acetyltransferase)